MFRKRKVMNESRRRELRKNAPRLDESFLDVEIVSTPEEAVSNIASSAHLKNKLNGRGKEYLEFLEELGEAVRRRFRRGGYHDLCEAIVEELTELLRNTDPLEIGFDTVDSIADVVEDVALVFSEMSSKRVEPEHLLATAA